MLPILKSLFRRKPVRNAALLDKGRDDCRVRNAQFVSFLEKSGFRERALAQHDRTKQFKKLVAVVFMWAVVVGFVWVAIESTQALDLF